MSAKSYVIAAYYSLSRYQFIELVYLGSVV